MVSRYSKRLVFLTRQSPFPGDSGSGVYAWGVLSHLANTGWEVHLVWSETPPLKQGQRLLHLAPFASILASVKIFGMRDCGGGAFEVVRPGIAERVASKLRVLAGRVKQTVRGRESAPLDQGAGSERRKWYSDCSKAERRFCGGHIRRLRPDWVIFNYLWMETALDQRADPRVKTAVLTVDVRHRHLELSDGELRIVIGRHWDPEDEKARLLRADLVIAIQNVEAAVFSQVLRSVPVVTAPPSYAVTPQPCPCRPVILFVGSDHAANLEGLSWFLGDVWPVIRAAIPDAEFHVVGGICDRLVDKCPEGVIARGRVASLAEAYAEAAVVVVPLLRGSGFKIKVAEAAAFGRTCVTTPVGIEGAECLCPPFEVATGAAEFALKTVALLRDGRGLAEAGKSAARQIARCFCAPACYADLDRALGAVVAPKPIHP